MKMKEEKDGKREETTKQRLLLVCLFSLPCCTGGHWSSWGKKLVWHVSKSGIKQPHLPPKHVACDLFAVLYLKKKRKKKRGAPKLVHCHCNIREVEARPVTVNRPLSLEHMWASCHKTDTQQKMTVIWSSLAWHCACKQPSHEHVDL